MSNPHRFIISYIIDDQPESIDVQASTETLSHDEARQFIVNAINPKPSARITDIRIVGVHHATNPDVRPGHYQQPEG